MRVLFVTGEFPPLQGGVGDCTNEIAQALAARGVETLVLTSRVDGRAAISTEHGVEVHRTRADWGWGLLPDLRRMIESTGANIVHIQYQTAAFGMHPAISLAPRLARTRGARYVVTYHDLRVPYLFPKAGPVREWVTFELARASDAAIATNEEDYVRLESLGRPVHLIPIGSNIAPTPPPQYDRNAWRARQGVAPGEILLSYFGFLNASKGAETLIRALALVPQARLIMVGGQVGASDPTNLQYLAHVKDLVRELGVTERVLWTDFMPSEEVSCNLLASDICVLPYRDGASFRRGTLMAALAHGLPIITTAPKANGRANTSPSTVPSTLPRLCDGENVLLVPSDDPRALADAIARLAGAPALRAQLARGALGLALAFTWDKIAAQHIELYQQLMK